MTKDEIRALCDQWVADETFVDGEYTINSDLSVSTTCYVNFFKSELTELPFKFHHVRNFSCVESKLTTTKNFPMIIDVDLEMWDTNISPYECRHLLLIDIKGEINTYYDINSGVIEPNEVDHILMDDRVNGVIPRNKVPELINKLRALS